MNGGYWYLPIDDTLQVYNCTTLIGDPVYLASTANTSDVGYLEVVLHMNVSRFSFDISGQTQIVFRNLRTCVSLLGTSPSLTSMAFLSLEQAGTFLLVEMPLLMNLSAPQLTTLEDTFSLGYMPMLSVLNIPSISYTGLMFTMMNCGSKTVPPIGPLHFGTVTGMAYGFTIFLDHVVGITSISIDTIIGNILGIYIDNATGLTSLTVSNMPTIGSITIINNADLVSVNIPTLTTMSGGLTVQNNAKLTLLNLAAVEIIEQGLLVVYNPLLPDLDYVAPTIVNTTQIYMENDVLHLNSIIIAHNYNLCYFSFLATAVSTALSGAYVIDNMANWYANSTNGNCMSRSAFQVGPAVPNPYPQLSPPIEMAMNATTSTVLLAIPFAPDTLGDVRVYRIYTSDLVNSPVAQYSFYYTDVLNAALFNEVFYATITVGQPGHSVFVYYDALVANTRNNVVPPPTLTSPSIEVTTLAITPVWGTNFAASIYLQPENAQIVCEFSMPNITGADITQYSIFLNGALVQTCTSAISEGGIISQVIACPINTTVFRPAPGVDYTTVIQACNADINGQYTLCANSTAYTVRPVNETQLYFVDATLNYTAVGGENPQMMSYGNSLISDTEMALQNLESYGIIFGHSYVLGTWRVQFYMLSATFSYVEQTVYGLPAGPFVIFTYTIMDNYISQAFPGRPTSLWP